MSIKIFPLLNVLRTIFALQKLFNRVVKLYSLRSLIFTKKFFIRLFDGQANSTHLSIDLDNFHGNNHAFSYYIANSLHAKWRQLRDMHHAIGGRIKPDKCSKLGDFYHFPFENLAHYKFTSHLFHYSLSFLR